MHAFEDALLVSTEDIEFELRGFQPIEWADYLLNPRRLRGSDFLMRWSQGVWSEQRVKAAVEESKDYFALPYGPSGVAPEDDPRAFELYFERLEAAGVAGVKRPDLLIFDKSQRKFAEDFVKGIGGEEELPFVTEGALTELLDKALIAVECENSLWVAGKMPAYGLDLKPQKRLGGKLGMPKTAVLPTVIVKEEDRGPLRKWQEANRIPIHIWHVFFDLAFGISFDKVEQLIKSGDIAPTEQTFQAPSGPTTSKTIFKIYYHHAYQLAASETQPELKAAFISDKNGHILPYVTFSGGNLKLLPSCIEVLRSAKVRGPQ